MRCKHLYTNIGKILGIHPAEFDFQQSLAIHPGSIDFIQNSDVHQSDFKVHPLTLGFPSQQNAVNKIPADAEKLIRHTTFLIKLLKEKYENESLKYGTLKKWLIKNSEVPDKRH